MKKIILCACILVIAHYAVSGQGLKKNNPPQPVKQKPKTITHQLNSEVSYPAFSERQAAEPSSVETISDPTIRLLNARANGSDVKLSSSGIVGMPKRAYGFANGRIRLNGGGATTSGTQTGSGAVGTGSSLGTFGSMGPGMGLNGKNPHVGWSMWGDARGLYILPGDSVNRKKH
jgi:hypothetical protein